MKFESLFFTSILYVYQFIISESMNWVAEDIYSTISGKNVADTAVVGARNDVFAASTRNQFEMAADRGERRGALDAAGLLVAINQNL